MKKLNKEELLAWIGKNKKANYKAVNILFNDQFNKGVRVQLREMVENMPER